MPVNVARFEILMYLSIVLALLVGILDHSRFALIVGTEFIVKVVAINVAATALLAWLIARQRQGWARWVLLILFVLWLPGFAMVFPELVQDAIVSPAMNVMRVILTALALWYIFTGDAREWFARKAVA